MVVCLCWSVSVRSVPSLLTRETLSFFSTKEEGEDDDGPVQVSPCVVFAQHWQPCNHGRTRGKSIEHESRVCVGWVESVGCTIANLILCLKCRCGLILLSLAVETSPIVYSLLVTQLISSRPLELSAFCGWPHGKHTNSHFAE